ncbi:MAG: hypothetical protein ACI9J3_000602 [Parvicellaceae bacterium]|jgi:hypothetical protein
MGAIYNFKTGENQTKEVIIHKNGFWGTLGITIDGQKLNTKMVFTGGVKKFDFPVDNNVVNIQVAIPKMFPGFRAWEYTVNVDGEQLAHVRK